MQSLPMAVTALPHWLWCHTMASGGGRDRAEASVQIQQGADSAFVPFVSNLASPMDAHHLLFLRAAALISKWNG